MQECATRLLLAGSLAVSLCGCGRVGGSGSSDTADKQNEQNSKVSHAMEKNLVEHMQWMLAMMRHFKDDKGHLLPTVITSKGEPLYSWRYNMLNLLAPSLELDNESYGHKWNDEYNKRYSSETTIWYCYQGNPSTNIVAITGKGTAFDEGDPGLLKQMRPDTIVIIEIKDSKINWMEPRDVNVDDLKQNRMLGVFTAGIHVGFLDRSVWRLSPNTPVDRIKAACYLKRPKEDTAERLLGKYVEEKWGGEARQSRRE